MIMNLMRTERNPETARLLAKKQARQRPLFLDEAVLDAVSRDSAEYLIKLGRKAEGK